MEPAATQTPAPPSAAASGAPAATVTTSTQAPTPASTPAPPAAMVASTCSSIPPPPTPTPTPAAAAAPTPVPRGKLKQRLGFVGAGQMALALAKGFMASGLVSPDQVVASAPSDSNLMLWRQLDAQTTHDNAKVIRECDIIFLAVKPNLFSEVIAALELTVLEEDVDKCGLKDSELILGDSSAAALSKAATAATVAELEATAAAAGGESEWEGGGRAAERAKQAALIQQQQQREIKAVEAVLKRESSGGDKFVTEDSKLFVSVMAGVTLKTLSRSLSHCARAPRVIRAHPNTPATVGCGCAVYSMGESSTEDDGDIVRTLFSSVGLVECVPEYQQDAFTGLAGSGPAFVYTFIEALSDGGVRMGLPRPLAARFAAQTALGAARDEFHKAFD